jgi:hypothetical protein
MKSQKIIYSVLMAVALATLGAFSISLSSCKGKDTEPSVGDKAVLNLVASPWKVVSVSVGGADRTSLFTGFTITFSKASANTGGYTSLKGGVVWPASGQWTIADMTTATTSFQRSDGVEVTLTEVTATSLKMSLAWGKNTFGPGRTGSVSGQHVFTMGK